MASKYLTIVEETAGSYGTYTQSNASTTMKILDESINTTREDLNSVTVERWTSTRTEGFFRSSGDFNVLVDPVVWPNLLVYFMGDPSTANPAGSVYVHTFKMGNDESVGATGLKSFSTKIGSGIEKDRLFHGCFINSLTVDCVNREVVSSTVSINGNGHEKLVTAGTPTWAHYTQSYLTFASASAMTIGGTDRLSTSPTIEAFRFEATRGFDTDVYVLGNKYLAHMIPSGEVTVSGSMDFTFKSQDEHERFLSSVGSDETSTQTGFAIRLGLDGATITDNHKYGIRFYLPDVNYQQSNIDVRGRDRIVQTVNWKANYKESAASAATIIVRNTTATY